MGFHTISKLAAIPALLGLSVLGLPTTTQALPSYEVSVNFPQGSGGGSNVSRSSGGASRSDSCIAKGDEITPLTVLMPTNNIGTTLDPDPSIFLFIPQTKASDLKAEIVITEVHNNSSNNPHSFLLNETEVYLEGDIPLPNNLTEEGKIVQYKLDGANLEAGKTYKWTFAIICDPNDRGKDESIKGLFERLEMSESMMSDSMEMTPESLQAKAEEYAAKMLWNETLEYTAQLREYKPSEWNNLLESVDLGYLTDVPFAE